MELTIPDEFELSKFDSMLYAQASPEMLSTELCSKLGRQKMYELLRQTEKTIDDYQRLAIQDGQLSFGQIEASNHLYVGQTRPATNASSLDTVEVEKCGYGKIEWHDGSQFEGYWLNNTAVGIGVFRSADSKVVIQGVWSLDPATKLQVFRESIPPDDQRTKLISVEVWSEGSYYLGEFENRVKSGHGIYYWADGSRYEGGWIQDEMGGEGQFTWPDGRSFTGQFQDGVMHGRGTYVWPDGRQYEGDYVCNKKHGFGVYTYSDGSKYRGHWVEGLQHGPGTIIDASQYYERKGIWQDGRVKSWLRQNST